MRWLIRLIALLCFLVSLGLSLSLRHATGDRLFTQLPSESLARMQQPKAAADDAFSGLGMNDLSGEPVKVDNEFRLGLLPAGTGHGLADCTSVLTLTVPPFLLCLFAMWFARRCRFRRAA